MHIPVGKTDETEDSTVIKGFSNMLYTNFMALADKMYCKATVYPHQPE